MELQSACLGISAPKFSIFRHRLSIVTSSEVRFSNQRLGLGTLTTCLKRFEKNPFCPNLKKQAITCCSSSSSNGNLKYSGSENTKLATFQFDAEEPFRGKSGSVSFHGLTHQLVEERKLVSAPFDEEKGSFLWVLAPVALISSLILPQFLLPSVIEVLMKEVTLVEIVSSIVLEVLFYIGFGTFLLVTDHVQRPYLQFSAKRWGLITGLRGYLSTTFFAVGLKVMIPLFAIFVNWPLLGLQSVVAVTPFLVGCAAQFAFETALDNRGSSCWPLVPIAFEVYRLYQLTRAAHFLQSLLFMMKDLQASPQVLDRGGALISMIFSFQLLGVVCLWSLTTFLLRLFPSRPVAENY